MAADRHEPLRARRNTPFHHVFAVRGTDGLPLDLTGHTAAMQVRLYGMQPGEPLIEAAAVSTTQTHGLTLSGSSVTAYLDPIPLLFMPESGIAGRDDRFSYDLILTAPGGHFWVERWGPFDLASGVTADDRTFLLTDTGAVLTTASGDYLEAA